MKKLFLAAVLFSANAFGQVYNNYPKNLYKSTVVQITSLIFNESDGLLTVKKFNEDEVVFTVETKDVFGNFNISFLDEGFVTTLISSYKFDKNKKRQELTEEEEKKVENIIAELFTTALFKF